MDILGITIVFIVLSTAITAILKAIQKDKCLKDFNGFNISLIKTSGEKYYGKLRLEASGLELVYEKPYRTKEFEKESSYILYKKEYSNIKLLARLYDDLTNEGKIKREKALKRSYHPSYFRKLGRKFINFCKTIKDAISEVVTLLLSQTKKSGTMQSQNKQISKIKNDMFGKIGTSSFNPLLEYHIGNIIILEFSIKENEEEKMINYHGVLKEYTSEFFEIMDVDFKLNEQIRKADLIIPRKTSIVRHLGE